MGTNLELVMRYPEGVHPVSKCIVWFDNEVHFYLHEVLYTEGHLGFDPFWWICYVS